MEISCIVIDDEPLAVSKLGGFIAKVPGLNLSATFDSAIAAVSWLKDNSTGLIFLDIQMEPLTGIEFLESIHPDTRIIITSAYDKYAIRGFELNVTDYLLKPFSFERFVKAVNKVMEYYSREKETQGPKSEPGYIFVKTEYRFERIDIGDILYIEGMKDYLRIVCTDKKIMTLQSFSGIERELPQGRFCRIHKSFIVALDKIRSVERGVVIIGSQRLPVSNTYRENFYRIIKLS